MSTLRRLAGATVLAGAGGLAWSLIEAQAFTVRRVCAPVLPPSAKPIKVLHISDLHLLPRQRRKIAWLRALADLRPDFVINTGDNMAHLHALPAVLEALEPLLAIPGAFVMGSNDYYAPRPKNPAKYFRPPAKRAPHNQPHIELPGFELGRVFRSSGWLDLTNRTGAATIAGTALEFCGVDDPHLDRDHLPHPGDFPSSGTNNHNALEPGTGENRAPGSPVRIGVAHAPYLRVLAGMRDLGCAAVFAGHTHGGQLCLPGFGALVTNCDLDRSRASGLSQWPQAGSDDAIWLHVSNGLGTSPYTPVRFACRPSVTLVELAPAG